MIKSIKSRIYAWFILFSTLLLIIVSSLNSQYYKKREQNNNLIERFEYLENKLLKTFNNSNAFFRNEITNPLFFETGKSKYLRTHNKLITQIKNEIDTLVQLSYANNFNIKNETDILTSQTEQFDAIFNQIVMLIQKRGYKDYGAVGEMREQVHQLEEIKRINQADVLMLRRHEKDYIIRNEDQYIVKLNAEAEALKYFIEQHKTINSFQRDSLIRIVDKYKSIFNHMVELDKHIGIRDNTGLKKQLDELSLTIENQINQLIHKAVANKTRLLQRARNTYITEIILAILLSLIFSYFIARRLTHPLTQLTSYISSHKDNDFPISENIFSQKADKEVFTIFSEFNKMIKHLAKRQKQRDDALHELKLQERRFRKMANMLPINLFETDENLNFTYLNKKFEETFRISNASANQHNLFEFLCDKTFQEELQSSDNLESVETLAFINDKSSFPVLVYCTKRIVDEQYIGIRGILIDITNRVKILEDIKKAKQRAEESDKLKSAFLANMSHEIRTPMNSIIGFSDLLNDIFDEDSDGKKYISYIQNSGQLLLKIIDDIIDISKIEAGKIDIKHEKVEVNSLLDQVHFDFLNIVETDKLNIHLKLEKETKNNVVFSTDPFRLKQILINLISNALKFTSEGHIHFGYKLNENKIHFFVHDTGIGIPDEKLDLIFERFRQVDDSTNRKYGGTGLGLSITQKLVELMGGEIHAESKEGRGSSFYFHIPAENYEIFTPVKNEQKKANFMHKWEKHTVMLVEDDLPSMLFLKELLKPTNIKIIEVDNGNDAVKYAEQNQQIDLILMDIHLPGLNGYEATKKIKSINAKIPIVAQTAYAMADEKMKCLEAGCNDYITKPIKKNVLFQIIEKYIDLNFYHQEFNIISTK